MFINKIRIELISFLCLNISTQKTEDEHIKKIKLQSDLDHQSKVYCPHSYLILNFHETLRQRDKVYNENEKDLVKILSIISLLHYKHMFFSLDLENII